MQYVLTTYQLITYNVNYRMSSREDILMAASDAFRQRGYGATGVAEILKIAGYKAPTLYYHFGDKEGLYVAWCEAALAELGSALRAANSSPQIAAVLVDPDRADAVAVRRDLALMTRNDSRERILQALGVNVDEPITNVYFALTGVTSQPDLLDVWITGLLGAISAMRISAPRGKPIATEIAALWTLQSEVGWRAPEAKYDPHAVK